VAVVDHRVVRIADLCPQPFGLELRVQVAQANASVEEERAVAWIHLDPPTLDNPRFTKAVEGLGLVLADLLAPTD
jgi:hypothetical protein